MKNSIIPWAALVLIGLSVPLRAADSSSESLPVPRVPAVPAKFSHPGLLHSLDELQTIKRKIEAGEEPWKSAFDSMKATKWAKKDYKPHPHEVVSSGFLGAGGSAGGSDDENNDALAAYTQALLWVLTGDEAHAAKSAEILNAWSILKTHEGANWYMMAEWEGAMFPQGAELLRATYPQWKKEDVAKFSEMLDRAFLPLLHNRMAYGNREFGAINAMMAIGVFNDDRAAFAEGLAHWVSYVPSWIYLKEDGPEPRKPDYWLTSPSNEELARLSKGRFADVKQSWIYAGEQVKAFMKERRLGDDRTMLEQYDVKKSWSNAPADAFVDGLCAETFRDLGHCDLGFGELINAAEIAWHQGIDLYGMHGKRIGAFMELYASLRIGETVPRAFWRVQNNAMNPTFEIAYNHYGNRMGIALPQTKELIARALRPCLAKIPNVSPGWTWVEPAPGVRASQITYPGMLSIAWETLTHAELGGKKTPDSN